MKHPVQGDVPPIPLPRGPGRHPRAEGAQPTIEHEPSLDQDPAMPVIENDPPCVFKPGQGITTLDVVEITLMYLMQLSGGPSVSPGALRSQIMSPNRVEMLSPEAQRWMKSISNPT